MSALPDEIASGDGRMFSLREPNPADMLDLIEAAGAAASSGAWMRYALMICSVSAIDGKPVMMPNTKEGIRDLARKIGNAGMQALATCHYPEEASAADAPDAQIDAVKN